MGICEIFDGICDVIRIPKKRRFCFSPRIKGKALSWQARNWFSEEIQENIPFPWLMLGNAKAIYVAVPCWNWPNKYWKGQKWWRWTNSWTVEGFVSGSSEPLISEGGAVDSALGGGGRVRSTIDNIWLSRPISPVKRSEQRKTSLFLCWLLFSELLTFVGIRRSWLNAGHHWSPC